MTKQGWTATVSTALFVVLMTLVALVPVSFVSWKPGGSTDLLGERDGQPTIAISGAPTYDTPGEVQLTTVAVTRVDASMTLPQAFLSYLLPDEQVLPREVVYPVGTPSAQEQAAATEQMATSQRDAVVAALAQAGIPIVRQPVVTQVSSSGPAYGKVEAGDLITTVNGAPVQRRTDVQNALAGVEPGTVVRLGLTRDGQELEAAITTVASQDDPSIAKLGIDTENSYQHSVDVEFGIDNELAGSSGGLAFALAIYDELTPGQVVDGRNVAATGLISSTGEVGSVGAVRQKVRGAERAGAQIMLVPESNCADVAGVKTSMTLVKVTTLEDAVNSLELLKDPDASGLVPRC
ncbi:PDZ domain-containing protein [Brooklawnia cerclae]|uniref:PDZ domain-containing protein n=1 Tax=Brooklawnia cerclae TaxID=349934 RepID=A0ABX0SGC0_9ACTN|nr:PDZ domain-containing protein [Brooklawnia cerclae]NIH56378.1 PDZ domain-containing protein [Brooklawnia cerclae]